MPAGESPRVGEDALEEAGREHPRHPRRLYQQPSRIVGDPDVGIRERGERADGEAREADAEITRAVLDRVVNERHEERRVRCAVGEREQAGRGDVIATGTPPGVGFGHKPQLYLKDGDVVRLGVAGLGEQQQIEAVPVTPCRPDDEECTPVVTTDAQRDPRFASKESVMTFALRSVMAAPLKVRGAVIGVIYVDNKAREALFVRDDLD